MSQTESERLIQIMADAILGSREFCGNEREAAREAYQEIAGRGPTTGEYLQAQASANWTWRGYQREAGVAERHCDGKGGLHSPAVHRALED